MKLYGYEKCAKCKGTGVETKGPFGRYVCSHCNGEERIWVETNKNKAANESIRRRT